MDVVTPEMVGISSTRLQRLYHVMGQYVERNQFAGLVTLIARHGQVAHLASFGLLERETGQPMRTDGIFRIASMWYEPNRRKVAMGIPPYPCGATRHCRAADGRCTIR